MLPTSATPSSIVNRIANYLHVGVVKFTSFSPTVAIRKSYITTEFFQEIDTTLSKLSGKNIEEY